MSKKETRRQVAALPMMWDRSSGLRVLLVTSRDTRRWIIPKGWPMKGIKDWDSAAIEARQEAGVIGKVDRKALGRYHYFKRFSDHFELIDVAVYPLFVTRELEDWPERRERQSLWLGPRIAANYIEEPELAVILTRVSENAAIVEWRVSAPK